MSYTDPCGRCGRHRADCECHEIGKSYVATLPKEEIESSRLKETDVRDEILENCKMIQEMATPQQPSLPSGVQTRPDEYYNQLTKNLGKTLPYQYSGLKCVTGCKNYAHYETHHHKDCPFYKNSLSERLDKAETLATPPLPPSEEKYTKEQMVEIAKYAIHVRGL